MFPQQLILPGGGARVLLVHCVTSLSWTNRGVGDAAASDRHPHLGEQADGRSGPERGSSVFGHASLHMSHATITWPKFAAYALGATRRRGASPGGGHASVVHVVAGARESASPGAAGAGSGRSGGRGALRLRTVVPPIDPPHGFEADAAGIDFQFSDADYFPRLVAEAGIDMPDMARVWRRTRTRR